MTKLELLEQITAIASTVNQTKYIWWVEHGGLISILNDLVKEYHKRFVNEHVQLTATQAKFNISN